MKHSIKLESRQFARVGKSIPKTSNIKKAKTFFNSVFSKLLFNKPKLLNKATDS